jgi:hypothetical protein
MRISVAVVSIAGWYATVLSKYMSRHRQTVETLTILHQPYACQRG